VSFIALIGALFVVSGGIHITVKGEATPFVNVVFYLSARFWRTSWEPPGLDVADSPVAADEQISDYSSSRRLFHFIVSNVGGCLTPIGDPPLFLGYLKGIPFWWVTEHCWPMWAVDCSFCCSCSSWSIIGITCELRSRSAPSWQNRRTMALRRTGPNLVFPGIIVGAVFISDPPSCVKVS